MKATIPNPKSLVEIHNLIKEYMPGSQTTSRKMLEEGMSKAQEMKKKYDQVKGNFESGGFNPVFPDQDICNVDLLIHYKLGAKRVDDNLIQWEIKDGKYTFNWKDGVIKRVL